MAGPELLVITEFDCMWYCGLLEIKNNVMLPKPLWTKPNESVAEEKCKSLQIF